MLFNWVRIFLIFSCTKTIQFKFRNKGKGMFLEERVLFFIKRYTFSSS